MIKNIIFDIGNVLLNWKPEEYLKQKGIESNKILEVHNELFKSEEWGMLDRGTIREEEARNIIINRSRENGHLIKLAFENWYEMFTPIEDSVTILKSAKNAGYNVYYLSVFHLLAFENVTKRYNFFELFDGGVASYEAKQVKPEEGIYKLLIEKYTIKPEESIFIDDSEANIEAAKKLNFNTVHLENPKDLRGKLRTYNINFLKI
ncbi:HAD family hydrolase [Priestia megaterium]|uniref:HAD family hydrolase n=1 Tax=Priestia megaterium TaxID=1404 RepID=UPI00263B544C|nr:HAD family phosphatase [Priestia megaterium]MDN4865678.1 HAD family phosphatase [Priestia megaterium]